MTQAFQTCEQQALKLDPKERAALAQRLIASLDELAPDENEKLWADEALRRYEEYRKGNIEAVDISDAIREARAALQ